jgi:hypothetical protein
MARDRATARQLNPERIQRRLKDLERRLDGDKKTGLEPETLTTEQRAEYLTIYTKLAKLLSDGDRLVALKSKGGAFS